MSNILDKSKKIQKEAQDVLKTLDLINLLSSYGKPEVIGSVALELMTWRDIDIEVVVENLSHNILAEVVSNLLKKSFRRLDFAVIDNRVRFGQNSKTPKSLYIGMKYFGDDIPNDQLLGANPNIWKIDIHFLLEQDSQGKQKTNEIRKKLTKDNRKIILEIKDQVAMNPKYRKEVFSVDIYQAVLDENVKNLKGFKEYLKKSNREL